MSLRNYLAVAVIGSALAVPAQAGGVAEPMMEPEVIAEESNSSGGILVPLLLLALIAAAVSSGGGGSSPGPS